VGIAGGGGGGEFDMGGGSGGSGGVQAETSVREKGVRGDFPEIVLFQ